MIAVKGKSRCYAYSDQQKYSSNCVFHILLRSPFLGLKNKTRFPQRSCGPRKPRILWEFRNVIGLWILVRGEDSAAASSAPSSSLSRSWPASQFLPPF